MNMKHVFPVRFTMICIAVIFFTIGAKASDSTQSFIENATVGNQFEISAGRLALQNSISDDVKQFAQQMVDDHTDIGDQLKSVISSSVQDEKQPTPPLDDKHQKILDDLQKASTKDFDKKYIKSQADAHSDAVSLFKDYADSGKDKALKDFAAQVLPMIERHQREVHKLKGSS